MLSYRRVGECRRLGLLENPLRNSHCAGDFAEYRDDIKQVLAYFTADRNEMVLRIGIQHGFSGSDGNE